MLSQGIGNFRVRLLQRAKKEGKIVVVVPAAYTSQTCNECGERNSVLGSSEVFECPSCGHVADRDINAACNIRDQAIELLEKHGPVAVGGEYVYARDSR